MTSAAITKREAIATAMRTTFADLPGAWTIYAAPTDIKSLPAVVLSPRSPYRSPTTFLINPSTGAVNEQLNLTANLFIRRDAGNEALDLFDEACDRVIQALASVSGYSCAWDAMTLLGPVDVDDLPSLGASIDIEVV